MKKTITIAIVAICMLATTFNANAQKVVRGRTAVPVTNVPVISAVIDTTPKFVVSASTALNQINQVSTFTPCVTFTGMISMPENAFVGDKNNLDTEWILELNVLDSNNVAQPNYKLKYTFTKLAATDLPSGRIGVLYTITNIPTNTNFVLTLTAKDPKQIIDYLTNTQPSKILKQSFNLSDLSLQIFGKTFGSGVRVGSRYDSYGVTKVTNIDPIQNRNQEIIYMNMGASH